MTAPPLLRPMLADDAPAVAALHAASWRHTYRGVFSDRYLDHEVDDERRQAWQARLQARPAGPDWGLVAARDDGALAGFVYVMPAHDPVWGDYIDNLHVEPSLKGMGLGRRLMQSVAQRLAAGADGVAERPLYLWVLDANDAAKRFYARLGAELRDPGLSDELPGGRRHAVWRCVWPGARALLP